MDIKFLIRCVVSIVLCVTGVYLFLSAVSAFSGHPNAVVSEYLVPLIKVLLSNEDAPVYTIGLMLLMAVVSIVLSVSIWFTKTGNS